MSSVNGRECHLRPDLKPRSSQNGISIVLLSVAGLRRAGQPLASGETVSQRPLEPFFQVRILARQPAELHH